MDQDLSASLARWAEAGVIDAETAERIRTFEDRTRRPPACACQSSLRWRSAP